MSINKVVINKKYGGFVLSDKAIEMLAERKGMTFSEVEDLLYPGEHSIERHDPDLVAVVETLGNEANHEIFSDLEVVSIFGQQYLINEYDGRESINTPETIPWITIKKD